MARDPEFLTDLDYWVTNTKTARELRSLMDELGFKDLRPSSCWKRDGLTQLFKRERYISINVVEKTFEWYGKSMSQSRRNHITVFDREQALVDIVGIALEVPSE